MCVFVYIHITNVHVPTDLANLRHLFNPLIPFVNENSIKHWLFQLPPFNPSHHGSLFLFCMPLSQPLRLLKGFVDFQVGSWGKKAGSHILVFRKVFKCPTFWRLYVCAWFCPRDASLPASFTLTRLKMRLKGCLGEGQMQGHRLGGWVFQAHPHTMCVEPVVPEYTVLNDQNMDM